MLKLSALVLGVIAAILTWTVAWSPTWVEFRPQGAHYRVLMPGKPEVETISLPLGDGRTIQMHQAALEKDKASFFTSHVDYPQDMINSAPPDQLLANVRDGSAKGHKLLSDKRVTMAGKPGREYVILRSEEPVYTLTRSVLVGNRLFQLLVVSRDGVDKNPDIVKFVESFELVP